MPKEREKKTATMWGVGKATGAEIENGRWGTPGTCSFR